MENDTGLVFFPLVVMAAAPQAGDGLKICDPSQASVELLQMKMGPEHRHMNDCLFGGPTQSPTE